jgi:hypothetical protein
MSRRRYDLAPHDVDLIEADAADLYEAMRAAEPDGGTWPAWPDVAESARALYRFAARNPYSFPGGG